jgi:hypothetical protein
VADRHDGGAGGDCVEQVINLVEVLPENWSFGNGIAQYVAGQA